MPNNWSIFPGTLVNVCSPFRNSISPTPTGTCVDGIQVRRMYVACKNRSGFPGTMPVGSDSKHEDVSVQAILEGLGLIASPGEESPKSASFNTTHNIWPVPEASESTSPSQSTDDTLPRLVQENAPTCLRPQCRILREELVPPTITVPVARREEYHGATAFVVDPPRPQSGNLFWPPCQILPIGSRQPPTSSITALSRGV